MIGGFGLQPSRNRNRYAQIGAAACAGVLLLPAGAMAGPALVFDTGSGEVSHACMAFTTWYPASLIKLMSAYVTFHAIWEGRISLEAPVTIDAETAGLRSSVKISAGTIFSVDESLQIILVASLNSVAAALARMVSGSEAAFVAEMNETAERLGMVDTRFVNPHGLYDPGQVTTARDLAVLVAALIRDFPEYGRHFEFRSIEIDGKVQTNHNGLLDHYPGADGMTTGYACESGHNIVGTATRDGRRLAAIVLGAFSEPAREAIAEELLDTGSGAAATTEEPGPGWLDGRAPASAPVDMRPYVCGKTKAPPELVSLGIASSGERGGDVVPLPRTKP